MIITGELLEQIGFKKTEEPSYWSSKTTIVRYTLGESGWIVLDEYNENYGWRIKTNNRNYPSRVKNVVDLLRTVKDNAYEAGKKVVRDSMIDCLELRDYIGEICAERESYN